MISADIKNPLARRIKDLGYDAIAVAGPTASGKTGLSIELARMLDAEIISCDSMQIYEGMDIATAKVTQDQMMGVAHHLIDVCPLSRTYSAADYVKDAMAAIFDISSRGKLPVFCGGTGLYLESVMRGEYPTETTGDTALRQRLLEYAQENGNHALHRMLCDIDPESAAVIHENNVKRVVRAIEIARTTGTTKTEQDRANRLFKGPKIFVVCLDFRDRELLYDRIERRVDMMVAQGLCEELEGLLCRDEFTANTTAMQAIGYKELFPYVRGEGTLEECIQELKRATRRYAKRQLTWFRAKDYVHGLFCDQDGEMKSTEALVGEYLSLLFE